MMNMTETNQLHIMFFPLMAKGHMLPIMDMAKLFAARGVKTTIVTTPLNAPVFFSKTTQSSKNRSINIAIKVLNFPAEEAGLPQGFESLDLITSHETEMKFITAMNRLQQPLEQILEESRPNALIADMFFPWTTNLAAKFGIPRLVFYGSGFFTACITESLNKHKPHEHVNSDTEPFIVRVLAHQIKLTRLQLARLRLENEQSNEFTRLLDRLDESFESSYGVIFNSFYKLEPAFADQYKQGRKVWHIGPVSLCNRDDDDKAQRGKEASIDQHDCLKWLDSKKPNSVVYVCFGSLTQFRDSQLIEIAKGLEASGQEFIWVVRRENEEDDNNPNWMPKGFEERTRESEKGLIIRGWAPQLMILEHESVGSFVTHCGWNSLLEGVSAGLPMVTWPIFAEQFFNEKLVTNVLKIGVAVGAEEWVQFGEQRVVVGWEAIEKGVRKVMVVSEEAEEMRNRARGLGEMAKRAVEEGGSSWNDLNSLVEELRLFRGL
ncbi:scopoletin glucosyltransferase-like [Camellia sinensis]|uniref:Glycosyltransferase n=1 Tax=Camellia sinensis var. sinensis TaxID=542762 RepID=A0A4S4F2V5_CAMSN|nr:scopoletin glucosyltransferase-like [Camellia sinensis]THG23394.1 hypothetical protein TEA_019943 [Camellia sinensis var. sinensis]